MSGREPTVTLRTASAGDRDFLVRVYASTREQELAAVPFTPAERAAFLEHQFTAQSAHYEREGNGSSFDIVLVDGEPAGRLIVGRWEREVRIVDIALLPEHRGHGVGGRLLREVLGEAAERGVVASIHVGRWPSTSASASSASPRRVSTCCSSVPLHRAPVRRRSPRSWLRSRPCRPGR
jgi:GNAT superfamily N-acetyltransferase